PAKIVTYDLAALDSLHALGVPVAGVPKSTYENALAAFRDAPVVGTLFEPDYAALKSVQPDLIIAGGRSAKAIPELQKVAPTVSFSGGSASFLQNFAQTNLALAQAFDKEEQAQTALAAVERNIQALHQANKGKTGAFLFVVRGNVMAHAPGDRFGYAYELAGLESVLPAKDPAAPAAPRAEPGSPEAKAAALARAQTISRIAQADPDWLIVLDRGAINHGEKTAEAALAQHPELGQTRAVKTGKVY